ncbi:MAG: 2-octaprenyl-6-methoxyphenyl hydroxylase, partial [Gammaproteobacteria bacterium]|nr:2-octaprenyl-6-methoxyphenyl hydroxylase [Gammaproteobacteria bacterium]
MAMTYDYDLIIVGGGMVGATLASALRAQPLRIGIIEAHPFGSPGQPSYDDRSIALAYGSRQVFSGMGLWETLSPQVTPIHHIHISNRGYFGVTRLHRRDSRVDALGYVVENHIIGSVLSELIAAYENIDLITPAQLSAITVKQTHAVVTYEQNNEPRQITAPLVVGADGAMSRLRELSNITIERREYEQSALIANVSTELPHNYVAYERFTDTGPIALLPLGEDRCSLVWTVKPADVNRLLQMEETEFLQHLQHRFGTRLGQFLRVGQRSAYPLALIR